MVNEIREIGIEKEIFLFNSDDKVMEPKLYGFPRDEFEFLVELRSLPSDRLYPILTTLQQEELQYRLRANKFGMRLVDTPVKLAEYDWVDNHWNKYNLSRFEDYTKNIYGTDKSHHFGLSNAGDYIALTAGIHVHFSSRNSETGEVIDLPIEKIVKKMDNEFIDEVSHNHRIKGEWESKAHGFEYRSLPCNVDVYEVLKKGFEILRAV